MIRLDKYLCEMEAGTRSEVKAFIKKGRVTVNGETAKSPEQKVDETKDTVTLDGHSFSYQKYFYYMLHKPAGVVTAVRDHHDQTVFVPDGEALAKKTFNPQLGIQGGISILGTTGIVEPKSVQALVDTIGLEIRQRRALGEDALLLTPGNYGMEFLKDRPEFASMTPVQCSNYIGEAFDFAVSSGFSKVILVGHIGKLVKLAGGIMNTHSRVADCRCELFAAHAALAGVSRDAIGRLMEAATTDACLEILDEEGKKEAVMQSLMKKIGQHAAHRLGGTVEVTVLVFSNRFGVLGEIQCQEM